jgi:hypothetical protein
VGETFAICLILSWRLCTACCSLFGVIPGSRASIEKYITTPDHTFFFVPNHSIPFNSYTPTHLYLSSSSLFPFTSPILSTSFRHTIYHYFCSPLRQDTLIETIQYKTGILCIITTAYPFLFLLHLLLTATLGKVGRSATCISNTTYLPFSHPSISKSQVNCRSCID